MTEDDAMTKSKKRKKPKKQKKKLTAAQRRARRERKYMTVFINGKQKRRVPREPTIDLAANADPIWLHQNEIWELMPLF